MLAILSYQLLEQSISNDHKRFDPCLALAVPMGLNTVFQRREIRSLLQAPHHKIAPICFWLIGKLVVLYGQLGYSVVCLSHVIL